MRKCFGVVVVLIDCGDGFIGIHMPKLTKLCNLHMCHSLYFLYVNCTSVGPLSSCLLAPPLCCIPPTCSKSRTWARMGQHCSPGCTMLCLDKGIGLQWRHLQEASLSWLWQGGVVAESENCLEWGICGHPRGWDWGKAGALCAYQRVWTMLKALELSWLVSRGKRLRALAYIWENEAGISGPELKEPRVDATPSPKNVPAGENLVIQERAVLPGSALSKKLYTPWNPTCTNT